MKTLTEQIQSTCDFDQPDGCHAIACYSGETCNSRDENRTPKYIPTEQLKKERAERIYSD